MQHTRLQLLSITVTEIRNKTTSLMEKQLKALFLSQRGLDFFYLSKYMQTKTIPPSPFKIEHNPFFTQTNSHALSSPEILVREREKKSFSLSSPRVSIVLRKGVKRKKNNKKNGEMGGKGKRTQHRLKRSRCADRDRHLLRNLFTREARSMSPGEVG